MRFRTRTQEVEAIQWTGDNLEEVQAWLEARESGAKIEPCADDYCKGVCGRLVIPGVCDFQRGMYLVWLHASLRLRDEQVLLAEFEPVPDLIRTVADYEGLPEGTVLLVVSTEGLDDDLVLEKWGAAFAQPGYDFKWSKLTAEGLVAANTVCSVVRLGGEQT